MMENRFENQERPVTLTDNPVIREACKVVAQRKADNPKTVADMLLMLGFKPSQWETLGFYNDLEGGPDVEHRGETINCYKMFSQAMRDSP